MNIDFVNEMKGWAMGWANDHVSDGADNWDWNHSNPIFAAYYKDYGVDLRWSTTDYVISSSKIVQANVYHTTYGPNDFPSTYDFDHTYDGTNTFEWTLSNTITTGFSETITVEVPAVFSSETGITFEVSTTASSSQVHSNTTAWTQHGTVEVPQGVVATVSMIVNVEEAKASANTVGIATGRIAIGLNSRWNGHYFWFVPITELAQKYNSLPQISVVGNEVHCTLPMTFQGNGGVSSHIDIKKSDGTAEIISVKTSPAQGRVAANPLESQGEDENLDDDLDSATHKLMVMMANKGKGAKDARARKKRKIDK